jgi:pyruvate formate-lyase/glycerol dehydratase family glycyl radical enzyme
MATSTVHQVRQAKHDEGEPVATRVDLPLRDPVRPAPGPRIAVGVQRNQTVTPEIFPYRAISVTESFRETEGQPVVKRRAEMLARVLHQQPVVIQEGELIVGMKTVKPRGSPVFPEINCTWVERHLDTLATRTNTPFFVSEETKRALREEVFPYWRGRQVYDRLMEAVPLGDEIWHADACGVIYNYFTSRTIGHITVGYAKVLNQGMKGIIADVEASLSRLSYEDPRYLYKQQFLEGVAIACEAAIHFAGRYAAQARRLAVKERDTGRRAELERVATICERVPAHPATGFYEALQSFWFTQLVLNLETDGHAISPGRFDQYIYPFYRRSMEAGALGQEEAQELLDLLWVKLDEITVAKDPGESETSSSYPEFQNLNIGGLTPEGHDATNDVSYMCLTALEHVKLPQPQLSAQISTKTPPKFLLRCCELLRHGMGLPAMFNSDNLVLGMVSRGIGLQDARSGSVNGCVSCNCDGKDRMASSGYFNLAKCLELALNNGIDHLSGEQLGPRTGNPSGFQSFDDVVQAFREQVRHFVELKVRYDDTMREVYATYCPVPFTSAVIDDCIDNATDWHAGGSRYKEAVISAVGIGTVADALAGIKRHVFDDRVFSMAELCQALDSDFQDREPLRQTLVNRTPHYGNDDDYADDLAVLAQQIFCEEVEKHRDIQGARYWINMLPTTSHIALGEMTWATADGRHARTWLSEGVSPVQGHDRKGPTAVARSVGKLDHARTNGTLLNLKISPQCLETPADLHKLAALIRGYFDQGGHHVQFNIIDAAVLRDAQKHPEEHRNLIIRVAGYSDYFVLLSEEIQEEILSRTEHGL